ncbi:hypothetical protein EKO04_000995 [Ascochyta lentis]|uniref:Carboxylic ester hydrolase n=1 Tax=Ascochyta lentis TaxID=205686 RepID=A0A8H7JEB4_9PLEO|nr:hypothetical protein EKO04_000995 [Ascochyta lentis]
MVLPQALSECSAQAIKFPTIFGATFLSVQVSLVQNHSLIVPPEYQLYRDDNFGRNLSFCNVTLTHTHPGQTDVAVTQVWLPIQPEWNGRLKMVGGGGWIAGLEWFTDLTMSVAVAESYATVTTNGGVCSGGPDEWALLSPGNLDQTALQNFAHVVLRDAALAAKSVITSYFDRQARFSYFDGCSQGGRQGLMFAQRYPDIFDGIQAAAPAFHTEYIVASHFPQQIMNEMKQYPQPCELDALTNLAIESCDAHDGLLDGIISDPDACHFDPYSAVGKEINCSSSSSSKMLSELAAVVADAAWNDGGLAGTVCSSNGTCFGKGNSLAAIAIRLFVKKDRDFDVSSLSRREYEQVFREAFAEFDSTIGTRSPYLYDFQQAGGKMLTYHGIADESIPFRGSRQYYEAVTAIYPEVHNFYRLFEAPGLGHCQGGVGGYPAGSFDALVNWVENGVAPVGLKTINIANRTSLLCPYPKKALFTGSSPEYSMEDFVCK